MPTPSDDTPESAATHGGGAASSSSGATRTRMDHTRRSCGMDLQLKRGQQTADERVLRHGHIVPGLAKKHPVLPSQFRGCDELVYCTVTRAWVRLSQ
jgi:hypothetical protein